MTANASLSLLQGKHFSGIVLPIIMLMAALAVYVLFLTFPPVLAVTTSLYNLTPGTALLLIMLFWLVFSNEDRLWEVLGLSMVLVLFAGALIYKWQTACHDGNLIGGILPWSDASGYYGEAMRLLNGEKLSTFGTRRPLFTGLLSVLFLFAGRNLQISLAILVAINALAVYLAACEVRKTYNALGASIFTVLCYLFYRTFAGKVLTENSGFAFGALGLALLLRGARCKRIKDVAWGIFLMAVALNARAGAFFVLPALVIWMALIFRESVRMRKAIGAGILVIFLGFGFSMLLVRIIGSPHGVPFINYADTFYGLASGNKGWNQVMVDHPGAQEMDVPRLAYEKFKEDPGKLFLGMVLSYVDYARTDFGAFSFLKLSGSGHAVTAFMWLMTGFGLLAGIRFFKLPAFSLPLIGSIGIFASVSLLPPIDADSMRAYAATIPLSVCVISVGAGFLVSRLKGFKTKLAVDSANIAGTLQLHVKPLSITLLVFSTILPLLVFIFADLPPQVSSTQCAPGQKGLVALVGDGSFVKIISAQDAEESYLPNIRVSDFLNSLANDFKYPFLNQELSRLKPGQSIGVTSAGFMIMEPLPLEPGRHKLCANPTQNEMLRSYDFYYVNTSNQTQVPSPPNYLSAKVQWTRLARILSGLGFLLVILSATVCSLRRLGQHTVTWWLAIVAGIVLLIPGVVIYLHSTARLPLSWQRRVLHTTGASHERGYCYTVPLGMNWMSQSDGLSPAEVFENGVSLSFPNAMHEDIRKEGGGRFSVWKGFLYFSASDNTDPRTNGRKYEIHWPTPISTMFRRMTYLLSFAGGLVLAFLFAKLYLAQ